MSDLPYRLCVGAVLFNASGQVLIARRAGGGAVDAWQLPQGGIDDGEVPPEAVLRELGEEIGVDRAEIIGEHPDWLIYDFPAELIGVALRGRYRGQRQRWFALRFTGNDAEIDLTRDGHAEFDAWRWVDLKDIPTIAVDFKRSIYENLAMSFAHFAK